MDLASCAERVLACDDTPDPPLDATLVAVQVLVPPCAELPVHRPHPGAGPARARLTEVPARPAAGRLGRVPDSKPCAGCGRTITWRRKWARDWESVRWCSQACRSRGVSATDRALEAAVLDLLAVRAAGATICPSEAARAVGGQEWRPLMEPARAAARRLVAAGEVEVTQGGAVVDPSTAKGPIRIRRVRR